MKTPCEMQVLRDLPTWRKLRAGFSTANVGFVPTMGALHAGHAALLKRARRESELTVLSIFVNPTQFNNPEDLLKYPVQLEKDLALARELGIDFVLVPGQKEMYPDGYRFKVSEDSFSRELCGAHRPGHFTGVLTVVMKLFQLVKPRRAYFGEKDFQQLQLIKDMAAAFFMDLEVVPCPTVREAGGLALSSRNARLSPAGREKARLLPEILLGAKDTLAARGRLEDAGFAVDYVTDMAGRRFGAVHLDGVRLIDNVEMGEIAEIGVNP
jgi:pantoate--beta-alanine ligase